MTSTTATTTATVVRPRARPEKAEENAALGDDLAFEGPASAASTADELLALPEPLRPLLGGQFSAAVPSSP